MKKTELINIGGLAFTIDDDAFQELSNYLGAIENHFRNSDEEREIVNDIELRIGELFLERLTPAKQVVNIADVLHVIETMGNVEQIINTETVMDEETYSDYSYNDTPRKSYRRMYRDPDNRVLGGVCGGLGAYTGLDPIIFRLAFALALLAYGTGTLVYILMWIIIPEAKTTAQKLEMQGKKVDVSSIENAVKNEVERVKRSWKNKRK